MRGLIFALLPLLASSAPAGFSTETIHEGAAPIISASNALEIPDSYIVSYIPYHLNPLPRLWAVTSHDASPSSTDINSSQVVFKKHVTESVAADHHLWVQDAHLESENYRTELRKRSSSSFSSDIFEGIKHTYNIAGDFLGYSGHFDDSVI